jgi:hypothetical protein
MYICALCNYSTDNQVNVSRHEKQKKHLENTKNNELQLKLTEMENNYKLLEIENKKLKQEKTNVVNNTQNKNINVESINCVSGYLKGTPSLVDMVNYVVSKIETKTSIRYEKFIDNIVNYYNNKILYQLLGNHILGLYKNNDLFNQSSYVMNITQPNYIVYIYENSVDLNEDDNVNVNVEEMDDDEKHLLKLKKQYITKLNILREKELQKAKSSKIIDKNGYKICKLLIDPTVGQFISILEKIQNSDNKRQQEISDILEALDIDKLKDDINAYIIPIFAIEN